MVTRLHGFNWDIYSRSIMPAFKLWLTQGDETALYQLYSETRCAREEQFIPPAMLPLRTWTRAQSFVKRLPLGSQAHHEYQILCTAETFTEVSDNYIHKHPPQLYQNPDTLRAIWGALLEEYCQIPLALPLSQSLHRGAGEQAKEEANQAQIIALLRSAGLNNLAMEVQNRSTSSMAASPEHLLDTDDAIEAPGVEIGSHPATLHLRGWLAGISVRAMALFELLACGRRRMPFGYRAGEPYEDYIGYLTPDETRQLASCLEYVQPPDPARARQDYALFRLQQQSVQNARTIDEVLPEHAAIFLHVIKLATQYDLGLLCSI